MDFFRARTWFDTLRCNERLGKATACPWSLDDKRACFVDGEGHCVPFGSMDGSRYLTMREVVTRAHHPKRLAPLDEEGYASLRRDLLRE